MQPKDKLIQTAQLEECLAWADDFLANGQTNGEGIRVLTAIRNLLKEKIEGQKHG